MKLLAPILYLLGNIIFLPKINAQLTWMGSVDSDFENAANWSPSQVPSADDDIIILPSPNSPVIASDTSKVKSMHVLADITIITGGKLTINEKMGSGNLGGNALVVHGDGSFTIDSNAILYIKNAMDTAFVMMGSTTNDGTILIDSSATGISDAGTGFGSFQNRGIVIGSNLTQTGIQFESKPFRNDFCSYLRCDAEIRITYEFNSANDGIVVVNSSDSLVLFDNFVSGRIHHAQDTSKIRIINTNPLGKIYDIPGATYWTGCQDSAWENPGNWLYLQVPDSLDKVVIPGFAPDAEVTSDSAVAGSLIVDNNGDLTIQSNAVFHVRHDTTGPAIACRPNASLRNHGTIHITAHSGFGLWNEGQLTQNGTININTDSIGIQNGPASGGINQNGIINITGISSEKGVWNQGSGSIINQSCGIIKIQSQHTIQDDANNFFNNGSIILNTANTSTLQNNAGYIYRNQSGDVLINSNSGTVFGSDTRMAIWTGCQDMFWHNPNNWSGAFIPRFRDSAIIESSNTPVFIQDSTAKISHLSMNSRVVINDGGILHIGDPTSGALDNSGTLLIEENGLLLIDTAMTYGLLNSNAGDSIINYGKIEVNEENISNLGIFLNHGVIVQENGVLTNATQGAFFYNYGIIDIIADEAFSTPISANSGASFENFGSIKTREGSSSIILGVSNPKSTFINYPCSAIDIDKPIQLDNGDFTNHGLINYNATTFSLNGTSTYTDDGYQFDPNGALPDGIETINLTTSLSYGFFSADIDHDGITFCMGDENDAENINNSCMLAFPVLCGSAISGSNNLWNTLASINFPDCVQEIASNYVGLVWYSFYGTGDSMEISVLAEVFTAQNHANLQIFEGSDAEPNCALQCIGGLYNINAGGNTLRFRSALGKQYFVAIGTFVNGNSFEPNIKDYSLSIQCLCEDRDILLDELQDFGLGKDFLFITDGEVEVKTDFPMNGNIAIDAAKGVLFSPTTTVNSGTLLEASADGCVSKFNGTMKNLRN